ncbi:di-trans,poly-cis-decaprenylcistransferase [candidate division WOR-1 bacterium RIFOXYB2_FULL_42_35]|uniref:Isoprenyl transferase n=1 Tax=candidate division WOR-1 bacterium RIFOXYC2_FULL_41_25 TaxID=1802586 RepID=A0A1F4TRL6_UNCSA|nr:MAG: di-trans,poly-cis-decaprenylcistransferase [candidate division WOR-1 bacterium RIFOXYA2_FULL_41_14]OGC25837.1 MAG: di-trans,poly-cis-decaprenylcistransferase [candidate division WOR-1 bacterium RIFOXYB2_FULL_42_35]OGC35277.1 MAG: di-trans,poly-cis-decaprenylcistransferase [candidate division WOR-1 bacterium RIFOXYC2_FULL_41_25]OGC41640.1 MAG: di-trans,poly-cis-decaprenylcistransferase [candidate division WOR-1 bacterium RIFOXYD2_FULL_41_8]
MDSKNIPQHIAAIMDGNGRWAKERGLPRLAGHREGTEALREILRACAEFGIKYLTVYAFSTENWQRPKEEVEFLMSLFAEKIESELEELMANQVKINFLGRTQEFSAELQQKMQGAAEKTKHNAGVVLNIMANYGGRAELVDAMQSMIKEQLTINNVDEETIGKHLYTKGMPDPDLLIRTANEMRISNFLLWQIAYAEIYVTPVLWPDFRREQLKEAIEAYQQRLRKFGQTEEQIKHAA